MQKHYGSNPKRINQHAISIVTLVWILLPVFLLFWVIAQSITIHQLKDEQRQLKMKLDTIMDVLNAPTLQPKTTPEPTATPSSTPVERVLPKKPPTGTGEAGSSAKLTSWTGKVSHYSRAGCLGCSENLTMANGQPLDDNALTIAFNKAPLGTKLKLTNMDNGKTVIVTVTDRGGFEKLGRIADLVPAVANALGTKTDITSVLFETL